MSVQVTTFAGSGVSGYADGAAFVAMFYGASGQASDSVGNVFVADQYNNRVRRIDWVSRTVSTVVGSGAATSFDGVGVAATLNGPLYLAMINGSLLVAHGGGVRLIGMIHSLICTDNGLVIINVVVSFVFF